MSRVRVFRPCAAVLLCIATISRSGGGVAGFMTGAPDRSCKDPSTFHTRRINASHEGIIMPRRMATNPYMLDVDAVTFGPGSHVTVTISGGNSGIPLRGFFIQAVQANIDIRDLRRQAFGTFSNTTSGERPASCQPVNHMARGGIINTARGGITHTSNETKASASAVWVAPTDRDPGNIQFLATGVFDYDTYWTDIRSPVLTSAGYVTAVVAGPASRPGATPTAAWYRWLQYIRQQQRIQQLTHLPVGQQAPQDIPAGTGHNQHQQPPNALTVEPTTPDTRSRSNIDGPTTSPSPGAADSATPAVSSSKTGTIEDGTVHAVTTATPPAVEPSTATIITTVSTVTMTIPSVPSPPPPVTVTLTSTTPAVAIPTAATNTATR